MAAESDGPCKSIQLIPFIHQVGGRASFLQLDNLTICKPLLEQEYRFYESLPDGLKSYIPEFRGVIEVTYSKENNGFVKLTANLPENCQNNCWHTDTYCKIRFNPVSGNLEIQHPTLINHIKFQDADGHEGLHNPWLLRCHQNNLDGLQQTQKYLLLENLTSNLKFPCVLDLKMGIRQYGDDANPLKIKSKTARSISTTSSTLGLRMCGMQVYQVHTGKYVCYDKYYGRTICADTFRQVLYQFLHNGSELRQDVVTSLISSIQEFCAIIKNLNSIRFYCSSLLVLYDGCKTNDNATTDGRPGSVKLIDFSHTSFSGMLKMDEKDSVEYMGPDTELLFGLENLISMLTSLKKEDSN